MHQTLYCKTDLCSYHRIRMFKSGMIKDLSKSEYEILTAIDYCKDKNLLDIEDLTILSNNLSQLKYTAVYRKYKHLHEQDEKFKKFISTYHFVHHTIADSDYDYEDDVMCNCSSNMTEANRRSAVIDKDGVLYSPEGMRLFQACGLLYNYSIRNDTRSIYSYAFMNNFTLHKLNIPNTVIKIGDKAFWGCRNLKSIDTYAALLEENPFAMSGVVALH